MDAKPTISLKFDPPKYLLEYIRWFHGRYNCIHLYSPTHFAIDKLQRDANVQIWQWVLKFRMNPIQVGYNPLELPEDVEWPAIKWNDVQWTSIEFEATFKTKVIKPEEEK